jgi:hypothetical protein
MWTLATNPLVPWPVIATLGVIALVLAVLAARARLRGRVVRMAALGILLLSLVDPALVREERDALPGVAVVVVDRSQSQDLGNRNAETDRALEQLKPALAAMPGLETRVVEAGRDGASAEGDGTRLFAAVRNALADVPPDRVAGTILLTDGQVHDVPGAVGDLGFTAPVHALITGRAGEIDRRLAIIEAPRFGLVGTEQTISFRVVDAPQGRTGGAVGITIRRDGEPVARLTAAIGALSRARVKVEHGGLNIFEIEAEPLAGELTPVNNRAVVAMEGIRDHLRVLLVSGEPNAGERTWRDLLKSDTAVDLVHFTILRPPEKQDGTPINELSLIAFPTRELFQEKIQDFDLIIFDRYQRRSILPAIYMDNIARYVRAGGAVLVASGPDLSGPGSLFRTPLASILPGEPTGTVVEQPFVARLSDLGKRHPVTRDLPGSAGATPSWSRWFRMVDMSLSGGTAVMEGPDKRPLLVLSREGEGRVGMLLSDHVWLWARGFEGGGPHGPLLRRTAHWLMKEPELEEEALRLAVAGRDLVVERQTLEASVKPITLTAPSGKTTTVTPTETAPGLWRGRAPANELGLWRANDGTLTALANVGPLNPREFTDVVSTEAVLTPLTDATGGAVVRLARADGSITVPRLVATDRTAAQRGSDWIGLARSDASVLKGLDRTPLFGGLVGLALLLGLLSLTWWREGK